MRTAVLFSGQGAQRPHLGKDLYRSHQVCRDVYDEASTELGYDVITAGERMQDSAGRHEIVQPLLVTYGMAAWAAAQERGVEACVMAGHSLGEIAALACAGALSRADAVRLARLRGSWMSECPAGDAWVVFGTPAHRVLEICEHSPTGEVWLANRNLPEQTVLSGSTAGLEAVRRPLEEIGATVKALDIGVPVHCPLDSLAAERMREAAIGLEVTTPQVPVLSTLTGEQLGTPDLIRRNLSAALTDCVDWVTVMDRIRDHRPDAILECGPKTVLRDLARALWPGVRAHALTAPQRMVLTARPGDDRPLRDGVLRALRLVAGTPRLDQSQGSRQQTQRAYQQLRDALDSLDTKASGIDADAADIERVTALLHEALAGKGFDETQIATIVGGVS
ncbi:ACP S-malonyltransferase [Streptomyces sp. IBSBF 2953]|nr:ACP S-malonyltransferase [Streptomyces hayashii]